MTSNIGFTRGELVNVPGIVGSGGEVSESSIPIKISWETTSPAAADEYTENMQILQGYLNLTNPPEGTAPTVFTESQLLALSNPQAQGSIANALINLITLARDGKTSDIDPNDPSKGTQTSYLTTEMVTGLNTVLSSFMNVGVQINVQAATPQVTMTPFQLQSWFNYGATSTTIPEAISESIKASQMSLHSFQAMIELEYVRTANDVLATQLADLQEALKVTKEALITLQNVQDLRNSVDVEVFTTFEESAIIGGVPFFELDGTTAFSETDLRSTSDYISRYKQYSDLYFKQPIGILLKPDSSFGFIGSELTFSQVLSNLRLSLNRQIAILEAATGTTGDAEGSALLSQIRVVRDNMSTYLDSPTKSAYEWLADGNKLTFDVNGIATINPTPDLTNTNLLQQNLTNAITAGQNFNDTIKNKVQNFLYVFQQFYQSASSILQNLTRIIEKIAQRIAQ
jgi:hypothetical protein